MKIIYIDKFDHFFSSGNYITAAFNTLGVNVIKIPLTTTLDKTKQIIISNQPDFVLCGKGVDYFGTLIPWLRQQNILVVHWSFDRLFYLDRAQTIIKKRKLYLSDLVCTTDGGCNDQWKTQFGVDHITLRQGIHAPDHIWVDPVNIDFDIVFIGSVYNKYRRRLIDFLQNTYGKRFRVFGASEKPQDQIRGLKLNQLLRSVKIVVGDSLPGNYYWSNRLYEQRGRGGFLLHPETVGMDQEFIIGEELVVFPRHDMNALKTIIDYYAVHDEEREKIRKCGFHRCPTYTDRVTNLLAIIAEKTGR
jgi:spore maturation protein CgeB